MAVQRRNNWISQQRVDVPDMRAVESAVSNDFDQLIQALVTNTSQGYIIRGFDISMVGAIGGAASNLQLIVDPGAVMHIAASQSGTTLMVPAGTPSQQLNGATNPNVSGAFVPNALNYVGLDYTRFIDPTTSAQIYVWDPTTNSEITKTAPRAQILQYDLSISTVSWPANILPIAIVQTDAGNNVVSIEDCRWLFCRLATGGANPDPFHVYPWTAQPEGRLENPSTSSSNGVNPFEGGDKMLFSLKDWMDAVMTSLLEVKGTTYWYSAGTSGSISSLQEDLGNTITTGKGIISHSADVAGLINWDEDIFLKVIGARYNYKFSANASSTDIQLADNEVAYVTLIRNIDIAPNIIFTNGSPTLTSVGAVSWTSPLQANDWVKLGSEGTLGYYQILSVDSSSQVTLSVNYGGASTGPSGAKAKYAFGTYNTSPSPSSNRDIFIADRHLVPPGSDVFWFLLRADNGGVIPRVYVRFLGSELEQGESEDIDDGVPKQLLQYIGAPLETSSKPQYVSALTPGSVPEITDLTCGTSASMSSNQYFYINSSGDNRKYYVWVNKNGTGVDPMPAADRIGVPWIVSTGQTNAQTATALAAALSGISSPDFTAVTRANPNQNIVRVTNNSAGVTTDASNVDVGSPFATSVIQQGTGVGNAVINDGDNLTLAIKKLDRAIGGIFAAADDPNYDEPLIVISGVPVDTNHVQGPLSSGSTFTLPNNSRTGSSPQSYTVGLGRLEIFLNGQYLPLNVPGSGLTNVGSNHSVNSFTGLGATTDRWGQSFTATASGVLANVVWSLQYNPTPTSGNLVCEIYSDLAGSPGTLLATSDPFDTSTLTSSYANYTFNFTSTTSLVSSTVYHIVLNPVAVTFTFNSILIQQSNLNPYAGGQSESSGNSGVTWNPHASDDVYFDVNIFGVVGISDGWTEVGASNTFSSHIQIHQSIVVGDIIEFRFGGGGGGAGGGVGPAGPPGPTGPPGSDAVGGPIAISTKTTNYTVLLTDNILKGNATGGTITFSLPSAASATGRVYWFKKVDASGNPVNVTAFGAELIDGLATQSLVAQNEAFILVSDGTTWSIF